MRPKDLPKAKNEPWVWSCWGFWTSRAAAKALQQLWKPDLIRVLINFGKLFFQFVLVLVWHFDILSSIEILSEWCSHSMFNTCCHICSIMSRSRTRWEIILRATVVFVQSRFAKSLSQSQQLLISWTHSMIHRFTWATSSLSGTTSNVLVVYTPVLCNSQAHSGQLGTWRTSSCTTDGSTL